MRSTQAAPRSRRWRAPLAIQASWAVHAGAAAAVIVRPHWWPGALGAVLADHLFLTAAGLWPRSRVLGPNWTHLPGSAAKRGEIAITIDDGPDPRVTPQVLQLLEQHAARATFFCVGTLVARHPELAREIVQRGHAIENHSQHHRHYFAVLGPRAMRAEIERAQHTIAHVIGVLPRFFRAPAGLRSPFLDPVLRRLDLQLASWTRRGFDTVTGKPQAVYGRLVRNLKAGDILLLHDGHAARTDTHSPVILDVLPKLLETITKAGLTPVTLRAAVPAAIP